MLKRIIILLITVLVLVACALEVPDSAQVRSQTVEATPILQSTRTPQPVKTITYETKLTPVVTPEESPTMSSTETKELETDLSSTEKLFNAEFFRTTESGQAIVAYLNCLDFDCVEKLEAVVNLGPAAVPPLLQLLEHTLPSGLAELAGRSHDERVIDALGKLRDERAIEALSLFLESLDSVVRARTVAALGQIGGDGVLDLILPMLQDPDQLVREMTAKALADMGQPEALASLRAAAEVEPAAHVRKAMEEAIAELEQH